MHTRAPAGVSKNPGVQLHAGITLLLFPEAHVRQLVALVVHVAHFELHYVQAIFVVFSSNHPLLHKHFVGVELKFLVTSEQLVQLSNVEVQLLHLK